MCVLSETHLITYRNSCSSLLSWTHISNSPSWYSLNKLHASKALLCFGVIYTHGGCTEFCMLLFNFCRHQHSQRSAGSWALSSSVSPYSHHGHLKLFFSRTWSNHVATATPEAFAPKSLQVTTLKVSAIDSICNHITAGPPQYFRYMWNATKTHLHTDTFSKTSLHTPHIHRSEAWGLGLL